MRVNHEIFSWDAQLDDSSEALRAVITFAKRFKATVGFLPDAAFSDRAKAGTLVIAKSEGLTVGYVLYSKSRSALKLTHVCVDPGVRRSGLAKRMLDHVIAQHPYASGLIADCRRDYGLDRFWSSLGFSSRGERPGRGRDGHPLARWWRPLGGPDLFDYLVASTELPLAVLDANVVIDLCSSATVHRPLRESSRALESDWLAALVEYVVSPETDNELYRTDNDGERVRQQNGSQRFSRLKTTRPDDAGLEDELGRLFGTSEMHKDPSLRDDVKHLADAIRAGAPFFITNDANLIRLTRARASSSFDIEVLRPHEFAMRMFEQDTQGTSFEPGVFEHIDLQWADAGVADEVALKRVFMNFPERERVQAFRSALRTAIAHRATHSVRLLHDAEENPLAIVATAIKQVLEVPLLRVARVPLAPSIALQLARELRRNALDQGATSIQVTDRALSATVKRALVEDGFLADQDGYGATVIAQHVDVSARESHDFITHIDGALGFGILAEPSAVEELERRYWPLRIWDESTPCYVIPITPKPGMDLFGYPANLLPQKRALGLSRRHVYYRSGRSNPFEAGPGRILWYMSKDRDRRIHQFFAISRLTGAEVLDADTAHERYSQLGVYSRAAVNAAADKKGRVNVVHLEDTELLMRPLTLGSFRGIASTYHLRGEIQSPRRIPAALFREIMLTNHLPYGPSSR